MRVIAVCPECLQPVPRAWFFKREVRPCPRCARAIVANAVKDQRDGLVFGGGGSLIVTGAGALVGWFAGGSGGAAWGTAAGTILAFPLNIAAGYWLFPYFTQIDRAADSPFCRACGYDLRATPRRCPECGTVPEAKAAAPA